ncbi:HCP-like protein [Sistotremastrum niveocremeum HHB9708]|uniref:HCP-like protein n=2 Tax=Sistotremastraceae TaxID=3402574 RepID=A0A165AN79_9AGAM|nr:HCP-like protein [Sistotremastrum niveocremeum HHB9708]KZT36995.1 HCP-like protein [Sistotremastrum suecicum HHB10207 ss-3]
MQSLRISNSHPSASSGPREGPQVFTSNSVSAVPQPGYNQLGDQWSPHGEPTVEQRDQRDHYYDHSPYRRNTEPAIYEHSTPSYQSHYTEDAYYAPEPDTYYDPTYNTNPQYPQHQDWEPEHSQSSRSAYDPLYAAAADVLGGAPPAPPASTNVYNSSFPVHPSPRPSPHPQYSLPPNSQLDGRAMAPPYSNQAYPSSSYSVDASNPPMDPSNSRPYLQRADTVASVSPSTRKTKAIDLTQPPYTREYIEQYRTRIKGDPDPEAHFLYAKYLIEAAKKMNENTGDQRSARKYRDSLVAESLKVIRRLATQSDAYAEAQFFLADCHGTGMLGLPVDRERAYHLYLQAAKQNHPSAAYRVAVCNEIGAGTRREHPRAFAFYRKAASLGDTPAMYKLGMILLTGALGQPKNPREAIGWLKRAAEQADEENPHALHELGLLHESPTSNVVVHDEAYAKELFTQAAQLGYTQSQFKLGQCYEYGSLTCPIDPRRSIAWYTKAAEKGDPEAELALSGWYLTGSEGVLKQSDSEAYLWARRAAQKGLSKAEYAVGYYAEVGIGVKQDIEYAKRWYMRAAAQGNKRAMNRLTELKRMGNKKYNGARPTRQQAKDECVIF